MNKLNTFLPLIRLCKKTKGKKAAIVRLLNQLGVQVNWGMVSGWLHPNEELRRLPRDTVLTKNFTALLSVQNELCGQEKKRQ